MASLVLASSEEKTNGFKLMRLIVDGGTDILRDIFLKKHPGNLHAVLTLPAHYSTLSNLKKNKKITQPQWDKLYPHTPKIPNIREFDITLLVILLRNICGIPPPRAGWNDMPNDTDNSCADNIVRIKLFRNDYAHAYGTGVSESKFETVWKDVSSALVGLGFSQAEIDRLKGEECGEEEVNRVRREWSESDGEVMLKLDELQRNLKDNLQPSPDNILSKCLDWGDFKTEIQSLVEGYTLGTREWVFQQVEKWLNAVSDNRTFIISAQAGMGKSTIAAVVCKRFPEQFAGCHFFQYNNSRYNKPSFLLQSLAFHLCNALPEYKKILSSKLSGKKGERLEDLNIEGLFSILFKEPLTHIVGPGKNFLIVIDALDEIRQEERIELADLIADQFHKFPKFIRFLITTRPENDIACKFHELKPMFLTPCDKRNICDLRLFFEDKLKTVLMAETTRKELVESLVENSEGLMLYASFLCKISEDYSIESTLKSLPKGIDKIYESYFNRLEKELRNLGVEENKFLRFLSVVAVAERPLPVAFIEKLFRSSEDDSPNVERTAQKITSCISSLLVIKDECVSFFHKSVKDWLFKPKHRFSINEKRGQKEIAEICMSEMETLKENKVTSTFDSALRYALLCGISHILQVDSKKVQFLTKFVDSFTDLETLHASVCIDVYTTLTNLAGLENYIVKNSLCTEMHEMINTLMFIIRKFSYILKDTPQSFLQHVLNESNEKRLSSKASDLLKTRYRELAYFETEKNKDDTKKIINRLFVEKRVFFLDVSSREDFIICVYQNLMATVEIELFSIPNFEAIWKRRVSGVGRPFKSFLNFNHEARLHERQRNIVFHPSKDIIFPGRLDRVLTLEGKFVSGPFSCETMFAEFTNCCFSNDKSKMATNLDENLIVWNLLDDNKEKVVVRLLWKSKLDTMLFSGNDRFLATTNVHELCIYDTKNTYNIVSRISKQLFLISVFDSDSWVVLSNRDYRYYVLNYELRNEPVEYRGSYLLFPLNSRAYQEGAKGEGSWLYYNHAMVFILQSRDALIYLSDRRCIQLVRPSELYVHDPFSSAGGLRIDFCSISVDGKYIYSGSEDNSLQISMRSNSRPGISTKLVQVKKSTCSIFPVTNGVIAWTDGVCELWNFDMTQLLVSFPELAGTIKCLSVADDLVACVMESQVCFFNVLEKKIVAHIPFPASLSNHFGSTRNVAKNVIACSSLYHVLFRTSLLLQNGNVKDLCVNKGRGAAGGMSSTPHFSPNGRLLAFISIRSHAIIVLDVYNLESFGPWRSIDVRNSLRVTGMKFFDDKYLLYEENSRSLLRLVDVETGDTVTCIEIDPNYHVGLNKIPFCVCRKTSTIAYHSSRAKTPDIIKLWLPHQRDVRK